ncbi:retrotransposon polyprotein, partial [Golovinomyces cichoracearum]
MWEALEQTYEGTGIVVQHQELINFVTIKYEDFNNLTLYITSFRNTIQRLAQVMDDGEKILSYWPAMLFVRALQNKYPIWADRQRNRQREKIVRKRPTLDELVADIQDKARRSNQPEIKLEISETTRALNANLKEPNRKPDKRCNACGSIHHKTYSCLHNNEERRKAWEEKTGKNWLSKKEFDKVKEGVNTIEPDSTSSYIVNKKVIRYNSSHDAKRVFPISYSKYPMPLMSTTFLPKALTNKRTTIISKDRWLADSGADTMVTNSISDFTSYREDRIEIESASGTTTSPGVGVVRLEVMLTNGTTREIHLNDVRYILKILL